MSTAEMQTIAGIGFLVVVAAMVALTFFSAALYSAINPHDRSADGSDMAGAARSIIIFGIKRKLKRVLFRHLI